VVTYWFLQALDFQTRLSYNKDIKYWRDFLSMTTTEKPVLKKIKRLVDQLNFYKEMYYEGYPKISDEEYDTLEEVYSKYVEEYPELIKEHSLIVGVGYKSSDRRLKEVKHSAPMLSLDKAKTLEDLLKKTNKWALNGNNLIVGQPKVDGVSLALRYDNGLLYQALTRKDGVIGQDVLHNVINIANIPKSIPYKGPIEIRGEAYIPKSVFQEVLKKYPDLENERNATTGAIRTLNTQTSKDKGLHFFAYDVYEFGEVPQFERYMETQESLEQWGFQTLYHIVGPEITQETLDSFKQMNEAADFLTDGIVFRVDSLKAKLELGYATKWPEWAVAFKFQSELKESRLLDIEWNIGKIGVITPVGIVEPVALAGVTVQRASLCNLDELERLGIKIGGRILIKRSNEVIPKIVDSIGDEGSDIQIPQECPSCGTQTIVDGPRLMCPNTLECRGQNIDKLIHSAKALDILNLGPKTIERLYDLNLLNTEFHLLKLSAHDLALGNGDAWQSLDTEARSVTRVLESIKVAIDKITPEKVVEALNIPGLSTSGKKILKVYPIEHFQDLTKEEIEGLEGFADISANHILGWLSQARNKQMLNNFIDLLREEDKLGVKKEMSSERFKGMTFVITGTLPNYKREQMGELIESHGGRIAGSVSKKTSYVIVGSDAGSKLTKAQDLGLEILDEAAILKMME
jgi:DNA ligase (NAD+)